MERRKEFMYLEIKKQKVQLIWKAYGKGNLVEWILRASSAPGFTISLSFYRVLHHKENYLKY